MSGARRAKLQEAHEYAVIIQFETRFEPGAVNGYVLDIGPEFFLLGLIDDNIRFNGFQCYRISDVRKLKAPAPTAEFLVKALRIRQESIDKKPEIDLSSIAALLRSANELFPLTTIHREAINPDTCKIGKVVEIKNKQAQLLEIDPGAIWAKDPSTVRLNDVTRVDFGGAYEDALHLVGGKPGH